jgi:hypothetical protein
LTVGRRRGRLRPRSPLNRTRTRHDETLERNLTCGHPGSEIRAALGILDNAVKAVELMDVVERVDQLEKLIADKEKKR